MQYRDPELIEHLAAQYVLGTLSSGSRRRFDVLLRDRIDLRLAVQQWQQRLSLLDNAESGVAPLSSPKAEAPSAELWKAIAARTRPAPNPVQPEPQPQLQVGAARQPESSSLPVSAKEARQGRSRGWFSDLWVGLGGFAAGSAVVWAMITLLPALFVTTDDVALRSNERLPQSYVGLLTDERGAGKVLVSSLRQGRTMTIKMLGAPLIVEPGTLVLWAEPDIGPAFVLGTLPVSGSQVSRLPDTSERLLSKVSRLKVTLEASPSPVTPGPRVILRGNCAKLW